MDEHTHARAALSAGAYRALFEGNPHPILLVDAQTLLVLRANDAASREYGYEREALKELPLAKLWPRAEETLARCRAGAAPQAATSRHIRRDGEPLEVEIAIQALEFNGRAAFALHMRNVTEQAFSAALMDAHRRVLEMVARASPLEAVLEELVRAMEALSGEMLGSVLLLDEDGKCARHGAAPSLPPPYWRAIDGLPVGPSSGSCGTAMHLGHRVVVSDIATDPLWERFREHALPWGLRACWSTPVRSRSGTILGAFAMYYREARGPSPRDVGLVEAATDLAAIAIEREAADRALQESQARLRDIVDHASALIVLKDTEGRYMLVNRRFEEVTGTHAAVALGRTDRQLFPREVAEARSASHSAVLAAGKPLELQETFTLPDGLRYYLSVNFPLLRQDGSPYAVCTIASDITERTRAERDLEQSREKLRALTARLQSVREEERLRISRDIHDQLGQTLTALRMNQSLLIDSVREARLPGDEARLAQLESMRELVTTMLSSVRRIAADLRPEALDTLGLAAALAWQAADFSRRTGIACEVAAPDGAVEIDAERSTALFRIFQEALTNVARHAGARRVEVALRRDGAFIEMRITDDGRGITQAEAHADSALGLLGMRERAAMFGGSTTIEGAPGRGTVVLVRLPIA